jgi:hypothetical protein
MCVLILDKKANDTNSFEVKMLKKDDDNNWNIITVNYDTFARILDKIDEDTENDRFDFRSFSKKFFILVIILKELYDNMSFKSDPDMKFSYYENFTMLGPYEFMMKYLHIREKNNLLKHHRCVFARKICKKFIRQHFLRFQSFNNSNNSYKFKKRKMIDDFIENLNIDEEFKLDTKTNLLIGERIETAREDCKSLVELQMRLVSDKSTLNRQMKLNKSNEITGRRQPRLF